MKEHPLLLTGAAVGTLLLLGIVFLYTQTPRPEVIAPVVEAPTQEDATINEQGPIFSGERGLDAKIFERTVTVTGPSPVLERIESCVTSVGFNGPGGNGLMVEWGDGTMYPMFDESVEGESCSDSVRTHTYLEPGSYTIVVTLWHPGPADEPITDWEDSVTVTVE